MPKPEWATFDPETASGAAPAQLYNLVGGEWVLPRASRDVVDPLNGEAFIRMPDTQLDELEPFVRSLNSCPKSGLHNMYKHPERYVMWGEICAKLAAELRKPEVSAFFAKCIQRVCPKSYAQSIGEVAVVHRFLENFSGDSIRFMAQSFKVAGDHLGQYTNGNRWPFGPVCCIAPFNFPLEIPCLQSMGAVFMGNKLLLKAASTTSMVMEQWIRLMHHVGAPRTDIDLLHCGGRVMEDFMRRAQPRVTQFTGSSEVAEKLALLTHGKIRVEDAGFDWKVLGPDVSEIDCVAWTADQDAYAHTGQKCSAQSILFAHTNWMKAGIVDKIRALAEKRSVANLTIGPVLSVTTQQMDEHTQSLLKIAGARLLFGGEPLDRASHRFPACYGAFKPTAVFVPLQEILKPENFGLCTTEIFGPFQVVTEYDDGSLGQVLECLERIPHHLTAAIVSNDRHFLDRVIGSTVNGTTYVGIRARTTSAPANHWFGPAGDPRGAGIGSQYAILLTWSCHRELIEDYGPVPAEGWGQQS